ncbi:hypothetical protein [Pseudemcibacter aquimaris]|uniref:hypothetical protein n=1 Tax=Pseudemcibacter aquimaris TaxID=2857064 RepID=UPI00201379D4|nr:hypothetical protein [Pseudemcibacter aquimaris]MCC3860670.1 hypothetical protein [Pseudemcibacter aquimaris]WDU59490.1 hypothetical protein KW060_04355 [Pseudemcibacter aquimaris]
MILRFLGIISLSLLFISSALAADIDGNWSITFSTAEGGSTIPFEIMVDGETVTADADGDALEGTYKDGVLKIKGPMYVPEVGMSATLDMTAQLEGNDLTGNATWDMYSASVYGVKVD